jgi:hypothetical protein
LLIKPAEFNQYSWADHINRLEIPAGSVLQLVDSPQRIERFALPAITPPLPAFGMELPAQSEVCDDWAVDRVVVPSDAYIEIGGVELTGTLNFDCGAFRFGALFADTRIRGETWTNGPNSVPGRSRPAAVRPALTVCFLIKTEIRECLLKPLMPPRKPTQLSGRITNRATSSSGTMSSVAARRYPN